jgi:molybdenum cofactor cytidylyltransferase
LKSAIIILAAGASIRLGKPKQLLLYKGKSLVQHVVTEAKNSRADEVVVILGANHDLIANEIPADKKIKFIVNDQWEEGMASSIKAGIIFVTKEVSPDFAILAVCDQPFIDSALFNKLIDTHLRTNKPIVASQYQHTLGTPVLFDKQFFNELVSLNGDHGARSIILKHPTRLTTIPFPSGHIDIDTNEQYKELLA